MNDEGYVQRIQAIGETSALMNGGFFVMSQEIFSHLGPGEDLVAGPFSRLAAADKLCSYHHRGFWSCMDTYKEKQTLDDMYDRGDTPWMVWHNPDSERVVDLPLGSGYIRSAKAR